MLRPMLLVAMVTGVSSFIYEISWIRMLTMIMGAATHSFELMLAAFILGLALGGLWLRKRIDSYRRPLVALGVIQLLMGMLALCTVLFYNQSMVFMSHLFGALAKNLGGDMIVTFSSQMMAVAMMLPVTFMAGMTLPLITFVLFKNGAGEASIGRVYAFNTLGAIVGVALAAMVLLPLAGLKAAVMIGAAMDLVLALYLFKISSTARRWQLASWGATALALVGVSLAAPFDARLMASSIFRSHNPDEYKTYKILMHQDGRTASVDVFHTNDKFLVLATNGKPDAAAMLDPAQPPTVDEPTMGMLGALPALVHPEAKTAAVIGMGAGMSADLMLTSKALKSLDVIEIEAAMIDGARLFGPLSARVFSDPRSKIHIDDAKSYFSAHKKRYDVIVSEPSDSWVSGVSNLFTEQFYGRVTKHLNDDGVLIQWLHIYQSSPELVASIFQALGNNFEDYRVYAPNRANLVIVARHKGKVPELSAVGLESKPLADALARLGWHRLNDIHKHEVGRKEFIDPLFKITTAPPNSDFFPYVDQNANKARYVQSSYMELTNLQDAGVPMPGLNFDGKMDVSLSKSTKAFDARISRELGHTMGAYFSAGGRGPLPVSNPSIAVLAAVINTKPGCEDVVAQDTWFEHLVAVGTTAIPSMSEEAAKPMLAYLRGQLCASPQAQMNHRLLDMMTALSARNAADTEKTAMLLLGPGRIGGAKSEQYALNALLIAYYQQGKWQEVLTLLGRLDPQRSVLANVVMAHAIVQLKGKSK